MKKKGVIEDQYINNGSPCSNDSCGHKTKECLYCGRINMRGNVDIKLRTGYVYLERLNSTYILEHNKLSPEQQELNTIKLWIAPHQI